MLSNALRSPLPSPAAPAGDDDVADDAEDDAEEDDDAIAATGGLLRLRMSVPTTRTLPMPPAVTTPPLTVPHPAALPRLAPPFRLPPLPVSKREALTGICTFSVEQAAGASSSVTSKTRWSALALGSALPSERSAPYRSCIRWSDNVKKIKNERAKCKGTLYIFCS